MRTVFEFKALSFNNKHIETCPKTKMVFSYTANAYSVISDLRFYTQLFEKNVIYPSIFEGDVVRPCRAADIQSIQNWLYDLPTSETVVIRHEYQDKDHTAMLVFVELLVVQSATFKIKNRYPIWYNPGLDNHISALVSIDRRLSAITTRNLQIPDPVGCG